ncbi:hypothetical protein [uncultured Duncaniella sp.]|uniref:hypothetical protein n=1 Tax=uncultured Duncaniella sp. TaxID=2768039 RepID=UPI0026049EE9|nr:hypothetical protein [uncultured Duncaniella sp.]
MEYTKNYHLPQWVKSDRIMMDDFNRMCADLENGLTGNRKKSEELSSRIEQVAGEAREEIKTSDTASQVSLKSGLLRLAYNHCHLLAAVEKQPPQNGCFFQYLRGTPAPSAASGLLERGDALWLARGTTAYSSEAIRAKLQQVSPMQVVKGNAAANTPLIVRFTPAGPGYFSKLSFTNQAGSIDCNTTVWHIAFFNENTGEYETETDVTIDMTSNYPTRVMVEKIEKKLCFSGGFTYRIEVSTRDDRYNGRVDYNETTSHFSAVSLTSDITGTLSRTVQCGEARLDGITLVHYRSVGTGGTLSLVWDGAVLAPNRTRSIVNAAGKPLLEAEFRRNAAIPAATSLQLRVRCNPGGDIALHSWAMAAV